jgi:hypothetical protein
MLNWTMPATHQDTGKITDFVYSNTAATARAKARIVTPQTQQIPTQEAIAVRAYELWEARGCPEDSSEEDWFAAEAQLTALANEVVTE